MVDDASTDARNLLDALKEPSFVCDRRGSVLFANAAATRFLLEEGFRDEVNGLDLSVFFAAATATLRDMIRTALLQSGEVPGKLQPGSTPGARDSLHATVARIPASRPGAPARCLLRLSRRASRPDIRFHELTRRVADLNSELRKQRVLALRDPLTQLFNRRYFTEVVSRDIHLLHRSEGKACLALLDIDHFKSVNDTFGHDAGDRVLTRIAEAITRSCRHTDVPCRWGGEEFAVFLRDTGTDDGRDALLRTLAAIGNSEFTDDDKRFTVTASAGITQLRPGDTLETLVSRGDGLLYDAKRTGRNRVIADD